MSERSTSLDSISESWEYDEDVLRHWGHVSQARVVSICRSELEDQIAKDGPFRRGKLLNVWDLDAEVLASYGHTEEADALRRCRDVLLASMNGDGAEAPTNGDRPASRKMTGPVSLENGGGPSSTDEEDASEEDSEEEEERPAWAG